MQFGAITVDSDNYIVIPIMIDGEYRTSYEIAPCQISSHNIDGWVEHMRSKSWWDNTNNNNFINALNYVANEKR